MHTGFWLLYIATIDPRSRSVGLVAREPVNAHRRVAAQRLRQLSGDKLDYLQACAVQILTGGFGSRMVSQIIAPVGAGVSSSASATIAASASPLTAVAEPIGMRQIRVWLGQQLVIDYIAVDAVDAASYEAAMQRRFASLRVTNDAFQPEADDEAGGVTPPVS